MRIAAEKCYAFELQPGDLFSVASQLEWDAFSLDEEAIGQQVYIRTNSPCPEEQENDIVFRITIVKDEIQQ